MCIHYGSVEGAIIVQILYTFSFLQGDAIFFLHVIRSKRVNSVYNMTYTHNSYYDLYVVSSLIAVIGERERANLIVTTGTIFSLSLSLSLYIYIYIYIYNIYISFPGDAIPQPSTRFQINATHDISQKLTTCV